MLVRTIVLFYQLAKNILTILDHIVIVPVTEMTTEHATGSGIEIYPVWISIDAVNSGLHGTTLYNW
jgi:hypothetical protein